MIERRVEWVAEACDYLLQVADFASLKRPLAAERFLTRLQTGAQTLVQFAERHPVIPELRGTQYRQQRELLVEPWRDLNTIHADAVSVIALLVAGASCALCCAIALRARQCAAGD